MSDENRESEIALYLAHRAYLYSALHVVFGAQPTADTVHQVLAENTQNALGMACEASKKGSLHNETLKVGVLGESAQSCLAKASATIADLSKRCDEAGFENRLRGDYSRLFDIPGDSYVHAWESPYVGTEGTLFQASTLHVREYYHEAGLKLKAEKRFPDDHIAAMMDYLGRMSEAAYNEFAAGDDGSVARSLSVQRRFLKEHVLTWADLFAKNVNDRDETGFYAAFSSALPAFAFVDYACIGSLLDELVAE